MFMMAYDEINYSYLYHAPMSTITQFNDEFCNSGKWQLNYGETIIGGRIIVENILYYVFGIPHAPKFISRHFY